MARGDRTTGTWVIAAAVALGLQAHAPAQDSRLRQRGPVPKVANPAAPLRMPTGGPDRPDPPGHGHSHHVHFYYPYSWYYGGRYDYWWHRRKTYDGPLLVEQVRKYDPQVINEAPAPPREVDEGLRALRHEDYRLAADVLARRLAEQERLEAKDPPAPGMSDREDQRLLAIALIGQGRFEDALRHALEAYRKDSSLRERPILGSGVIPSSAERTELVRAAVRYAQRRDAPESAWLLAAILMEADDRPDDARRVLARADLDLGTIGPDEASTAGEAPAPPTRAEDAAPESKPVESQGP